MNDMPDVYGCDSPTAIKEHKCYECHGVIRIGESYFKHHGIWSGKACTFKVCSDCNELKAEADKDETDPEWFTAFGHLYETVFNSQDSELMIKFISIKRKRSGPMPPWMLAREEELLRN